MVVEAIKKRAVTRLRITPEGIQGLLIGETVEVVEGVAHRFGGHGMKEGLKPDGAVHRDHTATGAQKTAERSIVKVVHTTTHAIANGQQIDQLGVIVVAAISRVVLERKMLRGMGMASKRPDHVLDEVMHAAIRRSQLDLAVAGHLKDGQEIGQMLQQTAFQSPFLPAVDPIPPTATQLAPEKAW